MTHVRVEADKPYADVTRDFESQLGRFDPTVSETLASGSVEGEVVRGRIEAMAGPSGLMSFGKIGQGLLLSLVGEPRLAVQFVVGNLLVAVEMTRHCPGAGLYAPRRVLIFETEAGRTCVEYDMPSSLFGRLGDEDISQVARTLDQKLGELVEQATGVEIGGDLRPGASPHREGRLGRSTSDDASGIGPAARP